MKVTVPNYGRMYVKNANSNETSEDGQMAANMAGNKRAPVKHNIMAAFSVVLEQHGFLQVSQLFSEDFLTGTHAIL